MAKQAGLAQQFFSHGYDLSGDVGAINTAAQRKTLLDITALNKSAMERISGVADGELSFTAFFNDAALAAHAGLSGLPRTDVLVLWLISASAGDPAAFLSAKQATYDGSRPSDGSFTFAVQTLAAAGLPLEWGVSLTAGLVVHASAASSASVDNGAATSKGLTAQLQVIDIDSGTPTVTIAESSDNGSGDAWATLLSFTAVVNGTEPTAERKTATGAIERYLRITSTGTFSNADIAVAARRGTAQDDVDLS